MAHILILYSTTDGHTLTICERIRDRLEQDRHRVELRSIDRAAALDPAAYDKLVIGASIRYGRHSKPVYDFIADNEAILTEKPSVFFSVSAVARKPNRQQPDTNPYVRKFLRQIRWRPDEVGVFAGKIDYPRYRLFDRLLIRLIMAITKGPTDPDAVVEFTDWDQVERFARRVGDLESGRAA